MGVASDRVIMLATPFQPDFACGLLAISRAATLACQRRKFRLPCSILEHLRYGIGGRVCTDNSRLPSSGYDDAFTGVGAFKSSRTEEHGWYKMAQGEKLERLSTTSYFYLLLAVGGLILQYRSAPSTLPYRRAPPCAV